VPKPARARLRTLACRQAGAKLTPIAQRGLVTRASRRLASVVTALPLVTRASLACAAVMLVATGGARGGHIQLMIAVPAGQFAYRVEGAHARTWAAAANLDGTNLRRLLPATPNGWGALRWSPDGTKVAATRGDVVVIATMDGRSRVVVRSPHGIGFEEPLWSPGGQALAFVGRASAGCSSSLWFVRADGTGLKRVLKPVPGQKKYLLGVQAWSPDGLRLLYSYSEYDPLDDCGRPQYVTRSSLMTVGVDGRHPTVLASDQIWAADWSPDGTRVAYLTCDFEYQLPCQAWVVNANGIDRRRVGPEVNMFEGSYIHWTSDGRELLVPDECAKNLCVNVSPTYNGGDCDPRTWSGGMLAIDQASGLIRPVVQRDGCVIASLLGISRDGSTLGFAWVNIDGESAGQPALVGVDGHGLQPIPRPRPDVPGAKVDLYYAATAGIYLP
jgi:dipeptidyl aminopeptidase/acylaminoacyl peptidase